MSAVTSPYGPTDMLSESVYNFAAASSTRRTASGQQQTTAAAGSNSGNSADQDCSDSQSLYDTSSTQLQLAASIQASQSSSQVSLQDAQNKPRNKRKNFKPISSRMVEISDESDVSQEEDVQSPEVVNDRSNDGAAVDYEVKTILQRENSTRTNNNEIIPMDLSMTTTTTTRPPSSANDDEDTDDSFGQKFILEQLQAHKLFSPRTDARSPTSESSDRSTKSTLEQFNLLADGEQDEDNSTTVNNQDETEEAERESLAESKPFENMREYAESTMQELLAIYGLQTGNAEFARNVNKKLTPGNLLNANIASHNLHYRGEAKVKAQEDKEAPTTAPGSPPTPPHTPQSPSRQLSSNNQQQQQNNNNNSSSSSSSGGLANVTSLSVGSQSSIQQAAAAAVIAAGLHPGLAGSPLKQILVQNPALAQLLQQNPAVLSQNPQLAQLLQQNLQAHLTSSNALQAKLRDEDGDEMRIPATISSSLAAAAAAIKAEGIDPKVSALLQQSMSPVSAADLLLGTAAGSVMSAKGSRVSSGGGGGGESSSQQQQQQQQPIIDYSRYVRRYGSGQECGNSYCKELGCREHFHCLDCSGGRVFVKKEEMIRHFKWHKKRDESLQHGFMRYSPTDDCAERHPGRQCPHNRKQTHYHCIHENCDKVYISTSDVQMHANYHRKDSAIIQEGFQRFRATENCATEHCPFVGQRTTHFHCRRPGCRYTFKNKADMDKHKSYHIKDEQLSRDGFKKFMKSEACPFEQCRFSRVCNHIHCIRPQCNYVLHSSGQLFSHKRKHERNDTELAYRRYKQQQTSAMTPTSASVSGYRGAPSSMAASSSSSAACWSQQSSYDDQQTLPFNLNGGESSNDEQQQHGSPPLYSMDDSCQSSNADFAMDLTATTTLGLSEQQQQQQQLTSIELAYLIAASADCNCDHGREHYHCGLERCGAVLRDPREVREHLREHEAQERITDAFFEEGGCDESSCPYTDKEKHYHCNWDNCREVILATDKPFRRLQHYKIHEYSRQLNLSGATSHSLSSEVTLTHLTNIDAMFRRKRGRPPKNRVIEIWSGGGGGGDQTGHCTQDSPQAIFTSFKLPKVAPTPTSFPAPSSGGTCSPSAFGLALSACHQQLQQQRQQQQQQQQQSAASTDEREGSISPDNDQDPVGFSTYGPGDSCPDNSCCLRSIRHHHCSQPRCHFSTDRPDQLLMHSKDFHDNVDIPDGFAFFDRMVDCRLTTCHNNRVNRHFHCTRPGCDYSFVRYSAMTLHDQQQHADNEDIKDIKDRPRIHVKNPAELIDKSAAASEKECHKEERSDAEVSQADIKTTVVRAAGTYYPVTGPPSESALPGAMLSMRSSVHQEAAVAAQPAITMISSAAAAAAGSVSVAPVQLTLSSSLSSSSSPSSHTLYGPEQSCSRPFCKLKRKNHYHCNACNQAFSELDRLVSHVAKHSAGAILGSQQLPTAPLEHIQQQQLDLLHPQQHHHRQQYHPYHHHHQQQQQQQLQHYENNQQSLKSSKDVKFDSNNHNPQQNQIKREQSELIETNSISAGMISTADSRENNQHQAFGQQVAPQIVSEPLQANVQQAPSATGFELDLSHSFHFPSPVVMAAMNQQIALMNQALPPFLQHGSMYAGAPGLMFSAGAPGLSSNNFLPTAGSVRGDADNPLASLAANLNLTKRSLSPSDATLSASDAKKQRLHHSMRMLKDEPVPDGYIRFRFNEDCRYPHCGYREHQTHFHCMRQDCGYSFCDKTRFVQHTARHERLDTLMGGDFQQYRANVPCGRSQCAYTSSLGSMQNKASHFHCLKCDFVCTDTNKVVAHRRQHAKLDSIAAAGFQKFTPSQPCGAMQCQHSGKQTHYHCLQCQYAVLGLAQMSAHKYRHMDA